MTTDECKELAIRLSAEAIRSGARGVIIAVSHDGPGNHSNYGIAGRGPCLELEGLYCRIKHYVSGIWKEALEPVKYDGPGGTIK